MLTNNPLQELQRILLQEYGLTLTQAQRPHLLWALAKCTNPDKSRLAYNSNPLSITYIYALD